jgi:hypothetical protein
MRWRDLIFGSRPRPSCITDDFTMALDSSWVARHEDTHYGFARDGDADQVTVSAHKNQRRLDQPTLLVAALDLVGIRQQAFQTISQGTIACSALEKRAAGGGMDVSFVAADSAGHIQCRVWVLARPARIVTLTYNRYPPLLSSAAFQQQADIIRAAVTVK